MIRVIDIETTGIDPTSDAIIEIASVDPATLVTAAQIELEMDDPQTALRYLDRIAEPARRANKIITYLEAKANMRAGHIGRTIALIRPLIQHHPDQVSPRPRIRTHVGEFTRHPLEGSCGHRALVNKP